MKKEQLHYKGFLCAVGVFLYIFFFSLVVTSIPNKIDHMVPGFFAPVVFLLLFVISASVTGSLVLGMPIMLFIDGKKKEALIFFLSVLGWLALFAASTIGILSVILK